MNTNTLCVLLPVYNAQKSLKGAVRDLLDVLPEIAEHFELCILDDGSTDDTEEISRELAAEYPQISLLRHPTRSGLVETIRTGLDHTQGEIVVIGDGDYALDADDLRALWQLRETQRRMSAYQQSLLGVADPCLTRLSAWKPRHQGTDATRGFQVIRRQAFEQFRLEQAADLVHRLNLSLHAGRTESPRPTFLDRARRFIRSE